MDFIDNLLLIKLRDERYFVRLNAYRYLDTSLFVIIDDYNRMVGYCFWSKRNTVYLTRKTTDKIKLKEIIGEDNLRKMKDSDRYLVFCFKDWIRLNKPLPLKKKVENMRRVIHGEEHRIKKAIIMDTIMKNKITENDKICNNENYKELVIFSEKHHFKRALEEVIKENSFYIPPVKDAVWGF